MSESVQEFLARQGYHSDFVDRFGLKSALQDYLAHVLGVHWQAYGGTIPMMQYLDASVVKDIQQALVYWQELNNENR